MFNARKIIVLSLLVLVCNSLLPQAPNWQWAKSFGSNSSDNASGIINDNVGNSYVCGYFFSSSLTIGSSTFTNNGNYDSYVAKFDGSGNPIWAKSFGGNFDDNASSITRDGSGNIYVAGTFISPTLVCGTTTLTNSGFGDFFVVKLDANGNFIWAKNFGDGGSNHANAIAADVSGNVFIAGNYNNATLTLGTYTLNGNGNDDAFVTKLDPSGSVMWAHSFGDNLADVSNGITTDASGNVFMTGFYKSAQLAAGTSTLNNSSPATADLFIIKLNNSGVVLNSTNVGDMLDEVGTGIASDNSGNIILTGYYLSPTLTVGTSTLSNYGNRDVLVIKADNNCNIIWAQGGGGSSDDYGYGIATDAVGRCYVNGHNHSFFATFGTHTLTIGGVGDGFLVAYDASGNALWADGVGGGGDDGWNALSCDVAGNIYCAGYFASSSVSLGATTLFTNGNSDLLIAKMINTTGGITLANHDAELLIYPNPSNGVFKIKANNLKESVVEVFDGIGNLILSEKCDGSEIELNISNHLKGIYIVRVQNGFTSYSKKLIIN